MVRWIPTLAAGLLALAACSREPKALVRDASGTPPPVLAFAGPVSTLHGRVLDEAGAALANVRVSLRPAGSTWSATRAPDDAFERTTDAQGRFRFDVPVPEASYAWLEVEPDPYHARAEIQLGADALPSGPRLYPGTNMVDDVRLAATGAVRGRVQGPDGAPLADAWVRAHGSTTTDADGWFQLGHLALGRVALTMSAPGHMARTVEAVVTRTGREVVIMTVRLERRGVLAGVVEDRDGQPVPGIRVEARADSIRSRAAAITGRDGRFALDVAANVPHVLSTDGRHGFLPWSALDADANGHVPGRGDVRIVLDRWRPVDFAVVDATTGAPVVAYSIEVREDARSGWRATGAPPWERVPQDGVTTLLVGTAPAIVRVRAPEERLYADDRFVGYVPFEGALELDAGSDGRMTIPIERGGEILLRLAAPSTAFSAQVVARRSDSVQDSDAEYRAVPSSNELEAGFDSAIHGLPAGTYDVSITRKGQLRRVVRDVHVASGEAVDLGLVALEPGAIASIRLFLPKDVSPVGLGVRLDDGPVERLTSKLGRRNFADLASGEHVVTLLADPPRIPVERTLRFTIGAGEVREFRFDVREP